MIDIKKLFLTNTNKWEKSVILFIILNILDCATTYAALEFGLLEGNPIMSKLFDINIFFGFAVKMLVILLAGLYCVIAKKPKLLKLLNLIVGGVVIYNSVILLITAGIYLFV